jgi:pimeloyl-ACP methyl ester carboxylesterase
VIGTGSRSGQSSLPLTARLARTPVVGEAMWRVRMGPLIKAGYDSAFAPGFDLETAFDDPDQVITDNRAMTYTAYDSAGPASSEFQSERPLHERLTAAGIPLLAILGSEDRILDTDAAAEDYRAVPGSEVRVMDGVGHSPNLEAPEDTAEAILRFAGAEHSGAP